MKIKAELVLAKDLKEGDLFSKLPPPSFEEYIADKEAIGTKVYIRLPTPIPEGQEEVPITKITIEE